MTRFIVADDGENEPTIWVEGGVVSVVRRVDLPPDARGVWDDLVAAVLAGQERGKTTFPGCAHERRLGAWGVNGECLACLAKLP